MKFQTPRCPECGELPKGMIHTLPCLALLAFDTNDEAEYEGHSDTYYDEQYHNEDEVGRVTLRCECDCEWQTEVVSWD